MIEITLGGKQNFMGREIPVVYGGFGEGKKCVSDKTIAEYRDKIINSISIAFKFYLSHFFEYFLLNPK